MTDISVFPTIDNVLYYGKNVVTMECSLNNTIHAGQVVICSKDGPSRNVTPALHVNSSVGNSGANVGVAIDDASSGEEARIALAQTMVMVANCDDTTAIDAGTWVEASSNTVGGTVIACVGGAYDSSESHYPIGITFEDIAGGGTGLLIVQPCCYKKYRRP